MQGFRLEASEPRMRERLWSPWRMDYIKGHGKAPKGDNVCILCGLLEMADGDENLILTRTKHAYVVMNRYPYTNGHLMVVPVRHTAEFGSLTDHESRDLMQLMQRSVAALRTTIRAQGFNIGMNIGRVAGAGIDEHLHFHVVPRWNGDTNFMPVLADVNLVNDHLIPCYRLIRDELLRTAG
jgi:ATP adenylyltransferase